MAIATARIIATVAAAKYVSRSVDVARFDSGVAAGGDVGAALSTAKLVSENDGQ